MSNPQARTATTPTLDRLALSKARFHAPRIQRAAEAGEQLAQLLREDLEMAIDGANRFTSKEHSTMVGSICTCCDLVSVLTSDLQDALEVQS